MHNVNILNELVIILAIIIVIIPLFRKINTPPLVGFLIGGLLIGPSALGIIKNIEAISIIAEVGVILLLFTIGLEFSLTRLKKIKRIVILGGGLQVGLIMLAGTVIGLFLRLSINEAIFIGFLISMSSTAIVMKLLTDRDETNSPHGKISLGFSLFQDLMIVPMMLLIPVLSNSADADFGKIFFRLFAGFGGIIALIVVSLYLMPKIIDFLVMAKSRELFVIGIVFISFGTALLTSYLGLSLALGAFIAGLVLSESEYSHEIVAIALPFRDALSSLFFISIGMLVDVKFIYENILLFFVVSILIILIKYSLTKIAVLILSFPLRTATLVGLSLSQIGEFSFILVITGVSVGLMKQENYQMFLGASIMTMLLTPLFIEYSQYIVNFMHKIFPVMGKPEEIEVEFKNLRKDLKNHVVVVGYGLNGKNLATVLRETGIKYIILESDGETVRRARASEPNIVFGDATRGELLVSVGIEYAKVLVIAISDDNAMFNIIKFAKKLNPDIYIIARTRSVQELEDLYRLGTNEVIPEEFETSIEIFTRVLRQYHIPRNVILTQVDLIRRSGYGILRGLKLPDATTEQLETILSAGTTDNFLVLKESPASGKSIAELNLRYLSGATIIAVVRDDKPVTNPPSSFRIKPGDVLVLIGTHAQIDKAFELLSPHSLNDI